MIVENRQDGYVALVFDAPEWDAHNQERRVSISVENAKAIIGLLEGYESALQTMDLKLLNSGRNDERFPLAIREVQRVARGLKAALSATRPPTEPKPKACPRCGASPTIEHPTFDGGSYVDCRHCNYAPQVETWAPTDGEAIRKWNELYDKVKGNTP